MLKRVIVITLSATFLFLLAACGAKPLQEEGATGTPPVQDGVTSIAAGGNKVDEPAVTGSSENTTPEPVRAIVFDNTIAIEDFMGAYNSETSYQRGPSTLKLTLFETSPGVFSGEGFIYSQSLVRVLPMLDRTQNTMSVERLIFNELKPDETYNHNSLYWFEQNTSSLCHPGYEEAGYYNHTTRGAKYLQNEYMLTVDGDSAQLCYIGTSVSLTYQGVCTELPPVKQDTNQWQNILDGWCISVNSVFFGSGMSVNHEYRAMLTATQSSGYDYAGKLCVYGEGTDIPFIDEDIKFTLEPFDSKAYKEAGGVFPHCFDAFGVINASAGKYIVLIDGETPILEPVGSEAAFYGSFLPAEQAGESQYIADETKQLMHTLYDGFGGSKYSNGNIVMEKPAWYPSWLIPKPLADIHGWEYRQLENAALTNSYTAVYFEYELFDSAYQYYSQQCSGYDNFETHLDSANSIASICFTKGAYSICIVLAEEHGLQTSVQVKIT